LSYIYYILNLDLYFLTLDLTETKVLPNPGLKSFVFWACVFTLIKFFVLLTDCLESLFYICNLKYYHLVPVFWLLNIHCELTSIAQIKMIILYWKSGYKWWGLDNWYIKLIKQNLYIHLICYLFCIYVHCKKSNPFKNRLQIHN
jgi:hypothetical protein